MFFKQLLDKTRGRRPPDAATLIEVARGAPDAAARRDACRALVQLDVLYGVASQDADAGVRDLAAARYRRLLCGLDEQAPPLAERSAALTGLDDEPLLAHVALHAVEPELRRAAIERLQSPEHLAASAVEDPLAANRHAAAERIGDRAALEAVQRRIGKRDKGVYRLVKERLRAIAEAEERPRRARERADALCEQLARLGRYEHWVQDHALLQHLDREWDQLEAELGDALLSAQRERRTGLRAAFLAGYEDYSRAHAEQLAAARADAAAAEQRADIIAALQACADDDAEADAAAGLAGRLADIERDWQTADPAAASAQHRRAYAEALAAARARQERLDAERRRHEAAGRLRRDAEQALQAGELDQRRVQALEQRLDKLGRDGQVPEAAAQAVGKLATRLRKHREQVRRKLAALPERLAELDRHFADGQLKQAEPLYQSIRATLDQARGAGLPAADTADAEAHLKSIAPQLKELQRWRRWGADTRRQGLCEDIERLAADTAHELEPLANHLAELQDDWRTLDRNGAPADDALWQRFRAAADTIRERCKPFYEAQAKIRAANREQRLALCEQLEAFLDQVDWERMDWKKAMRAEREMRRAWAALGPESAPAAGRRRGGQRPLEGRFRKSLRRLDDALNAERARNLAERRDLIEAMQHLTDVPDLREAIESAKALQRRWHPTVTGRQRDENALWQEFRAAADAVFGRREAEQQARNAELETNLASREAVCAGLEQAVRDAADADALRTGLDEQRRHWQDMDALPVPKAKLQGLRRRWQQSLDAAQERLQALAAAQQWARLAALEQRAGWCDQAARSLAADNAAPADAEALRSAWDALPPLAEAELAAPLEEAAALVLAVADGEAGALERLRARMDAAAAERRELCLRLEVAAGVDSPPELEQARMALQVQRLKAHMTAGAPAAEGEDALGLLRSWYLTTPAAAAPDIDARVTRVRQALAGD